ncbi:hypothetical protein HRbin32_00331 [bacterium HR32]|nr:hypothetical protein HRbin32_00331 [bacterium HR32]
MEVLQSIEGHNALGPPAFPERGEGPALRGKLAARLDGAEAQELHQTVRELTGAGVPVPHPQSGEGLRQAHEAQSYRPVAEVGPLCAFGGVQVEIQHVVQAPHGEMHRPPELRLVHPLWAEVTGEVDAGEVTHRYLLRGGGQVHLRAQIAGVDGTRQHAPGVAGVLEGQPRVTGLLQGGEDLPEEVPGSHHPPGGWRDGAALSVQDPRAVGLPERLAPQLWKLGSVLGVEEVPGLVPLHPVQELVGDPQRGVEAMGPQVGVSGVLLQVQEGADLQVPGLQVHRQGPTSAATLADGLDEGVEHVHEGDDAGAGPVDAAHRGAGRPKLGDRCTDPARVLCDLPELYTGPEDVVHGVLYVREVAAAELVVRGARVEQRGGAGQVVELACGVVEPQCPKLRLLLAQAQAHGDPQEQELGQLQQPACGGLPHEVAVQ